MNDNSENLADNDENPTPSLDATLDTSKGESHGDSLIEDSKEEMDLDDMDEEEENEDDDEDEEDDDEDEEDDEKELNTEMDYDDTFKLFEDDDEKSSSNTTQSIADIEFPTLSGKESGKKIEEDMLHNIPVGLSVELGRTKISLQEVFELNEGSIIELERLVGEPLDLVINGQTIAQGEVVAIDNNYGLRITNVLAKTQKE